MCLFLALLLLGSLAVCGQPIAFTINGIGLLATPSYSLRNGDQLKLKCKVDIAKTGNFELTSTIYFFKEDNQMIHNVTTKSSEATYIIPKVRVSTSGLYKCKVKVDTREAISEEIQIKVTGLSAPTITLSKYEVTEGDDVIVRCEAPEEEPPMIFGFYKSTSQAKDSPRMKTTTENSAEAIFKIKEGESYMHFECDVKLVRVTEPMSNLSSRQTVTVVAPFGIPSITVQPSNNFTEGTKMEVTCSVLKSHMNPQEVTITLQKDNQILKSSTSGTLSHSRVASETDTGNYMCKVEGRRASKSTSTMITVQELFSKPILKQTRKNNAPQYISEDETLSLECSVPSLSLQESLKQDFYLNYRMGRLKMNRGSLDMTVREDNSGHYTCEVTISNITKRSNPLWMTVYAPVSKPILQQVVKENRMVVLGDTLTLTCKTSTGTPPICYTLYRGNEQLGTMEITNHKEATFRVNVTKSHDLGQYRCNARNRNNKPDLFSDVVNVTVITPIEDVALIIIPTDGEVEEGAELSLICSVTSGSLPINFQFYVKKDLNILMHNMTKNNLMHAEYEVPSFTKQKEGFYFCSASNQANKNVHSRVVEVKAVLASWKKGVISAFVLLIIVTAIGIIIYLYLDKKRKEKKISTDTSRMTKVANSTNNRSAMETKAEDVYFGSVQNEEELHILRSTEDTIDNSQQNHDMHDTTYTEADGSTPDTHQDPVENNISRAEDPPELNNLS